MSLFRFPWGRIGAAIAVAVLLAVLAINARPLDVAAHGRTVARLSEIKELDSRVDELVLELRYGLLGNYDVLNATLARMQAVSRELREGLSNALHRDPTLKRELGRLEAAIAWKERLVEDFKTDNALLKNSLSYLPLSVESASRTAHSAALDRSLAELLRDVLLLHLTRADDEVAKVADDLDRLRSERSRPKALSAALDQVVLHAANAVRLERKLDELTEQIAGGAGMHMGRELTGAYNQSFAQAVRQADAYKWLLTALALGLIAYAAYSFIRQRRAAIRLAANEEHYRRLVEFSPDAIVINVDDRLVYANAAALALIGATAVDDLVGMPFEQLLHPDYRDAMDSEHADVGPRSRRERKILRLDGQAIDVEMSSAPLVFQDKPALHTAIRDITERKKAESQMAYLAQYDTLTGLPNRNLFRDRLGLALARAKRESGMIALLFLDLDRFKEINDTLGHGAGDRVLKSVAKRLRDNLREVDTVARLGGDEFTIVLERLKNEQEAAVVAQKIRGTLAEPIDIDGRDVFVAASIGIAVHRAGEHDIDTLIMHADIAMYQAKHEGRNNWQYYSHERHAKSTSSLGLESALRRALERDELLLHYQPKVSAATRDVVGVEALLRWRHGGKLIPPVEFIPLAEETGLIAPIGEWILHTACAQAKRWHGLGLPQLNVAVNLSARQFRERNLVATVAGAVHAAALDPRRLELEITESMIMHQQEKAIGTLEALAAEGARLAIDDFGIGYSSLAYLKRFPVHILKVDRSFVRDIGSAGDSAAIVRAIVSMAHSLKLSVTAEGVETREQMEFLESLGCDEYQGYLFARPMPPEELEAKLVSRATGGPAPRPFGVLATP